MPEVTDQSSPTIAIAPQPADMPLYARPGQPPSLPTQPPVQAQPTPQQAVAMKHHALGALASALFGTQADPQTGAPIKERPGVLFRNLLAGALMGGAAAEAGRSAGGGFFGGFGRGVTAVDQRQQQAQQTAFEQNERRKKLTLEEQRAEDEHMLHQATAARMTVDRCPDYFNEV